MIKEGDTVKWKWGDGFGQGVVKSMFEQKTTRKIANSEVTRNGTVDDPALYIEVEDGNNVLKLSSEVQKA
jgi:hypothetical protein